MTRFRRPLALACFLAAPFGAAHASDAPETLLKAPAAAVSSALARSQAATPREYRKDAAGHIYSQHGHRIFKGRMPPLLQAVGVLEIEVGPDGEVQGVSWMRAPRHVPEVMAEIERMVRACAPFPVPANMGKVTYTDTWLWHKSGRFQLDTLTEGQD